jgi:UDP-glucose 4-epimerase
MAGNHAVPAAAIVNGASGLGVTVEQILGHLFEALGADHEPEFTGTARAGDPRLVVGDCTRALGWGWSPQRAWRDGVREYARWFRAAVN